MALLDSMFLFEIVVEELKSFVGNNKFIIKSEFADIFSVVLKKSIDLEKRLSKPKKISKNKTKVKNTKNAPVAGEVKPKPQMSQSVMFSSDIDRLMSHMLQYPMEISLWSVKNPRKRIGSTLIPWNSAFVEFLTRLYQSEEPPPVVVNDVYNIFDEISSKRMAAITLNLTFTHIKDKIPIQLKVSEDDGMSFMEILSKPVKKLNTVKKPSAPPFDNGTGVIKTFYSGGKRKKRTSNSKKSTKKGKIVPNCVQEEKPKVPEKKSSTDNLCLENVKPNSRVHKSIVNLIKSDVDIDRFKQLDLVKTKSCSSIKRLNALNYVFGDRNGPFGNRIYTVGYFTVKNTESKSTVPTSDSKNSESSFESKPKFKFKLCSSDCPSKKDSSRCDSECSLDLPADAADSITVTRCKDMRCLYKKDREPTDPRDDRIMLDLSSLTTPCCVTDTVVGAMKATVQIGDHPCYCACECKFGFGKKTTYCKICGGYESAGETVEGKPAYLMPPACPIYHKLTAKRPGSNSGSETKTKKGKTIEVPKEPKKGKKKRKDDRFKFNYGYKAPQIGHSQCAMPCTGTMNNVPKNMGWLWTADNIPALKFRPMWKPGAINKFVLRMLKMGKNPGEVSKKRRKDTGKKKRPLKRPLLVVHKKDGEYTVTMETMKAYAKPRALNQQPYEDKEVLTYTIGRTEEENRERRKKKERAQRRLERDQREFIQSAFRDMCEEICLKTYQQALGILPDAEDPECTCYPALPGPDQTNLDRSCSCSEDANSLGSDTDSDEWIVEFTPPSARFDPTYKGKKVTTSDNETQYTYLDYRVKLLDRFGNPVPRFFKGLDGKQQCSDLGGFWSPDHQWLEINVDGYVAPDGRWAPLNFIGPNGEQVDTDTGKFQAMNGRWLVVGIDGFIDSLGKWKYYPRRNIPEKKKPRTGAKGGAGDKEIKLIPNYEKSERSWSCFGDASPVELSKMGIVGHGADRKMLLKTLKDLLAKGEKDIKLPEVSRVPRSPASKKGRRPPVGTSPSYFSELTKCKHPTPSDKGIVVDHRGRKTYFKSKEWKNMRPGDRLHDLEDQGRSVSTFHEPCYHSFTNSEAMKQQLRERLINMAAGVQPSGHNVQAFGFTTEVQTPGTQGKTNKGLAQFLKKNMVQVATQSGY
ncbi:uncharacterized protein isoform X2 [Choristoneura fumiferana]|uniref:uncharacterized protein isoform X2 n=1 Tax=Choristoneura fumiferana TaxID=7141 RepID=UPI003D159DDD